jgi:CBS domain-containing protein
MSTDRSVAEWVAELRRHPPFAQMRPESVATLAQHACRRTYEAGHVVLESAPEPVAVLRWIASGAVAATAQTPEDHAGFTFTREAGDLFPMAAVIADRPATATYRAVGPLECLEFDADLVRTVAAQDTTLGDFMRHHLRTFAEWSQRAAQSTVTSYWLAGQTFESELSTLARRAPVAVAADAMLAEGLRAMHAADVGSVLVLDGDGTALGILTRHDLLPRVALQEPPLDIRRTPMREVMSQPVHTLDVGARVHDAALLMSRHAIRHVPLTSDGRVVGLVSERDLFALQRLSLRQLGDTLRMAPDLSALAALAPQIPTFARQLLTHGVSAPALTSLVSHLNDLLTQRLVILLAGAHGLDLRRACWVAFGSEGRGEQTIATDQDNGLVLDDGVDDAERERWLAMAGEANLALRDYGFPLCQGGIMAGSNACCLRLAEWRGRFEHWMTHGAPEDLLNASIFFDLRPLAGHSELGAALRAQVTMRAPTLPRFLRLLAENSLRLRPALTWLGALDTEVADGGHWLDLKLHGTAPFVDAARLMALGHGIDALGTRERFERAGVAMGVPPTEADGWACAFEALQMLRLRAQVAGADGNPAATEPNRIDVRTLNAIDRRLLKEALRAARAVQQRLHLDWLR